MMKRLIASVLFFTFLASVLLPPSRSFALDSVLALPTPGTMISLSSAYEPLLIKGLTVHKDNPFMFDFVVDAGHSGLKTTDQGLKTEADRLIKYFFACLTVPEKDLWVNLSPYEKDRMVPQALGQTALGRDLLAQDYILKQLTASLIYPEKDLGKEFWNRIYTKARELYGTSEIPVNTFNKVWILADKATVYEHGQTAFVVEGHLKVMLEEDYLSMNKHKVNSKWSMVNSQNQNITTINNSPFTIHQLGSKIVRELILPELEREVNQGKNFATLRQIFNSLILANWYKKNLKEALLNQVYADKSKVNGIERPGVIASPKGAKPSQQDLSPEEIYQQYLKAYKKGVFNYIKEDAQVDGQAIPKKYFSGGFAVDRGMLNIITDQTPAIGEIKSQLMSRFILPIVISAVTLLNSAQFSLAKGIQGENVQYAQSVNASADNTATDPAPDKDQPTDVAMTVTEFQAGLEAFVKNRTAVGPFVYSGANLDFDEIWRLVAMDDTDEAVDQIGRMIDGVKDELIQKDIAVKFATVRAAYHRRVVFDHFKLRINQFSRFLKSENAPKNILDFTIKGLSKRAKSILRKIQEARQQKDVLKRLNKEWDFMIDNFNSGFLPNDLFRLLPRELLENYGQQPNSQKNLLALIQSDPAILDVLMKYDPAWAQELVSKTNEDLTKAIKEHGSAFVVTGPDPVGEVRKRLVYAEAMKNLADQFTVLVVKTTNYLLKDKQVQGKFLDRRWQQAIDKLEDLHLTPNEVRRLLPVTFLNVYFGDSSEAGKAVTIIQQDRDILSALLSYDTTWAQTESSEIKDLAQEFADLAKRTTDLLLKQRKLLNLAWGLAIERIPDSVAVQDVDRLVPRKLLDYYNGIDSSSDEEKKDRKKYLTTHIENQEDLLAPLSRYNISWAQKVLQDAQRKLKEAIEAYGERVVIAGSDPVEDARKKLDYAKQINDLAVEFSQLANATVALADAAMTVEDVVAQLPHSRSSVAPQLEGYISAVIAATSKESAGEKRIRALEELSIQRTQIIKLLQQLGVEETLTKQYLISLLKNIPESNEPGNIFKSSKNGEIQSINNALDALYVNKPVQRTLFDRRGNIVAVPLMSPPGLVEIQGGIDFTDANSGLTIRKDSNGVVKVDFDFALIARIQAQGVQSVLPMIVNIRSMTMAEIQPLIGL